MANKSTEETISKSLIRLAKVVQIEDNLETSSSKEISRNSFGRRIKVKFIEDNQELNDNDLPWVWPLLPKHLQIIPKVGERVMVFLQSLDSVNGNRFYIGPIISQDYYLNHGGEYESLSLLQGISTTPLCHPSGNPLNDGAYPDSDVIAIQGRGDAAMWLKDEELRLMCGHKPQWNNKGDVERADNGRLTFNKESLGYIQLRFGKFIDESVLDKNKKEFNSVINVVADRINLISHNGAESIEGVTVTDQKELTDKESIEKFATEGECMVYGNELVKFLTQFRQVFGEHTHHWLLDRSVKCKKDEDFWTLNLDNLLCKTIRIK